MTVKELTEALSRYPETAEIGVTQLDGEILRAIEVIDDSDGLPQIIRESC